MKCWLIFIYHFNEYEKELNNYIYIIDILKTIKVK